jgi:hypothetical protein
MNNILLACGMNRGYFERGREYIDSLYRHCNIPFRVYCLDELASYIHHDNALVIPSWRLESQNGGQMLQNGNFAKIDQILYPDEVVCFTDCDIVMQRPWTAEEIQMLESWPDGTFGIAWNAKEGDTLREEYRRINVHRKDESVLSRYEGWENMGCFNCGVIVAKAKDWRAMFEIFRQEFELFYNTFPYKSSIQWLICWIVQRHFKHQILGGEIHSHGHFGIPAHVTVEDGVALYKGTPILFRHVL